MGLGDGEGAGAGQKAEGARLAVPALPMPVAVLCCVLNFIFPGLGTFVAGCCNLCCGKKDGMTAGQLCAGCAVSTGIAFLQLLTTVLFFIGWIWSCIWGVTFIGWSANYYHGDGATDNKVEQQPQVIVINNQGGPGQPQVIMQPQQGVAEPPAYSEPGKA